MKSQNRMDILFSDNGEQISIEGIQTGNKESVAKMFTECRKSLGLTQNQVAQVAGMDRANIARFENAGYNPSLEMLTRLASAMGKKLVISLEDDCDCHEEVIKAYHRLGGSR